MSSWLYQALIIIKRSPPKLIHIIFIWVKRKDKKLMINQPNGARVPKQSRITLLPPTWPTWATLLTIDRPREEGKDRGLTPVIGPNEVRVVKDAIEINPCLKINKENTDNTLQLKGEVPIRSNIAIGPPKTSQKKNNLKMNHTSRLRSALSMKR